MKTIIREQSGGTDYKNVQKAMIGPNRGEKKPLFKKRSYKIGERNQESGRLRS